ncbi:hypothetical protein OHC33_003677 [Knufia fluminis]|uniref:Uncharacterized protein n=1 Tax=Knufia fluminis TaxID=191047 RepID=A0AAN8EMY5_9EURO|nr:hypothetical protein OHC33_003677 [Knufia fluminis]
MTVPAITDAPDSGSQQFAEAFRHTIVLDLWVHPITCMVDEQSDDMPRSNHHRRLQIQLDAGKIIFMRPLLASMATINSKPYRLTEAATSFGKTRPEEAQYKLPSLQPKNAILRAPMSLSSRRESQCPPNDLCICDEHHTLTLKDIRRIIHDVLTHQVTIRTDASSGAFSKTEQIANKIIRHNGLSR